MNTKEGLQPSNDVITKKGGVARWTNSKSRWAEKRRTTAFEEAYGRHSAFFFDKKEMLEEVLEPEKELVVELVEEIKTGLTNN